MINLQDENGVNEKVGIVAEEKDKLNYKISKEDLLIDMKYLLKDYYVATFF